MAELAYAEGIGWYGLKIVVGGIGLVAGSAALGCIGVVGGLGAADDGGAEVIDFPSDGALALAVVEGVGFLADDALGVGADAAVLEHLGAGHAGVQGLVVGQAIINAVKAISVICAVDAQRNYFRTGHAHSRVVQEVSIGNALAAVEVHH